MQEQEERIAAALAQTQVVRQPKQHLATFGATNLRYFLVTDPVYAELGRQEPEAVLREGRIVARRPEIVTPTYLLNLAGFSPEARHSLAVIAERFGPNSPGLQYVYENEAVSLNILSGTPSAVADNVAADLERRGENLAVVLRGAGDLWDVSLLKFIFEYTVASLAGNVSEMSGQGLLEPDRVAGIPRGGVERIERLFNEVQRGSCDPSILKQELDRWGLFARYEDRFLSLFRRR